MNWYIGQRVVCINAEFRKQQRIVPLVLNQIYTIRFITQAKHPRAAYPGAFLFGLAEIKNRTFRNEIDGTFELCYYAHRFRPLTDINIFTAMLNQKEPAQ